MMERGPLVTNNVKVRESGVKPGALAEMTKLKVPVAGGVPLKIPVALSSLMPANDALMPQVTLAPGTDVNVYVKNWFTVAVGSGEAEVMWRRPANTWIVKAFE